MKIMFWNSILLKNGKIINMSASVDTKIEKGPILDLLTHFTKYRVGLVIFTNFHFDFLTNLYVLWAQKTKQKNYFWHAIVVAILVCTK